MLNLLFVVSVGFGTNLLNDEKVEYPDNTTQITSLDDKFQHGTVKPRYFDHGYSQISITQSCGDYFYKFELPEVQINLHFG